VQRHYRKILIAREVKKIPIKVKIDIGQFADIKVLNSLDLDVIFKLCNVGAYVETLEDIEAPQKYYPDNIMRYLISYCNHTLKNNFQVI